MGNPKAFLTIPRQEAGYRPIHDRISDYSEVEQTLNSRDRKLQASRCMDCGVPFCHWACPLGNKQPEFQDALYKGKWEEAYKILNETNDFPEFTGRICPALCEKSCMLLQVCSGPVFCVIGNFLEFPIRQKGTNVPMMGTHAKMQVVASDRARRENVPGHIFFT